MTKLIDPLSENQPSTTVVVSGTDMPEKVLAGRHANETHDICPSCNEPLKPVLSNDIETLYCKAHRIVFPTKD